MDPKQTEGQGSTVPVSQGSFSFSSGQPGSGQSGSGQPPAAQSSTLSTGANVSRTMDDLNVSDRKSATSNSPFAKHHFDKVAPGTGDIIISPSGDAAPSAPKQGINRGRLIQFGLIFGGIALVGLVIFTVVMVINNQPKTNTNSSTNNNSSNIVVRNPKDAFEEFLEVLVNGKVGESTYSASNGKEYTFQEILQAANSLGSDELMYADKIINYDVLSTRNTYLDELSSVYEIFARNYSGENENLLEQIAYYYRDFANIKPVSEEALVDTYQNVGYESAIEIIEEDYAFNSDRGLNDYNTYSREYAKSVINLINDAKNKIGCEISNQENIASCTDLSNLDSYQSYASTAMEYYGAANQIRQEARRNALGAIGIIYQEYFKTSENGSDI